MNHLSDFLIYIFKIKKFSNNTVDAYRTDLDQFLDFLKKESKNSKIDFNKINKKEIKSYILFLSEMKLSEKSINRKLASIKSFFRFLYKKKLVKSNPSSNITGLKIPKKLPRFIQNGILFKVLEYNSNDDWETIRDKTILELFFSTGIRLSELIFLDLKDVEIEDKILKVIGKGNKERIVPFGNKVCEALSKYLKFRNQYVSSQIKDFPLFISKKGVRISHRTVQLRLKKLFNKVSLNEFTPHLMRHTFATQMINNGADIRAVQEILGHSSLSSTQIYTHLKKKKLKEFFDKAHPHAWKF